MVPALRKESSTLRLSPAARGLGAAERVRITRGWATLSRGTAGMPTLSEAVAWVSMPPLS